MTHHLVILEKVYLQHILRGRKSAECRLSRTRRPPFGLVKRGDTLWLKQSGGQVVATARVRRVSFVHPLRAADLARLLKLWGDSLRANQSFFKKHEHARYATLIELGRVRTIEPFDILKSDRHAWVVLAAPLYFAGKRRTESRHSDRPISPRVAELSPQMHRE